MALQAVNISERDITRQFGLFALQADARLCVRRYPEDRGLQPYQHLPDFQPRGVATVFQRIEFQRHWRMLKPQIVGIS